MKHLLYTMLILLAVTAASCGSRTASPYDAAECQRLCVMAERGDSISQQDYAAMIDQSSHILRYIAERNEEVCRLPEDSRCQAERALHADPEYMERFGYMFTLGSTLYKANANGSLDRANREAYQELDRYNQRLADSF